MDLESRGRLDLADEALARYLAITLDGELPLLLPFYEAYRAYVIGKISTFAAADSHLPAPDRAARHFRFALSLSRRAASPRVIVVAGPSGSGKSTLDDGHAGILVAAFTREHALPLDSPRL